MEIRELPIEMIEDAVGLWEAAGLTRPWNDPRADIRRALDGPASTLLARLDEDELIATVMIGHDGHRGWVYYLAVRPATQRQGHGRLMMEAAESWLTARHIPKLNLMVRSGNDTAQGFYEALGYGHDDVTVLSRRLSTQAPPSSMIDKPRG
jgi:ribosomal protein S18 acetylase RimI-like enzyme